MGRRKNPLDGARKKEKTCTADDDPGGLDAFLFQRLSTGQIAWIYHSVTYHHPRTAAEEDRGKSDNAAADDKAREFVAKWRIQLIATSKYATNQPTIKSTIVTDSTAKI